MNRLSPAPTDNSAEPTVAKVAVALAAAGSVARAERIRVSQFTAEAGTGRGERTFRR